MRPDEERVRRHSSIAGFTLIEALISTALMVAILGALALVTAQWMRNWDYGFARVQQTELTAKGLDRIIADLSAAEFIPPTGADKGPLFDGATLAVTLVRSALGPNSRPGLEFIRIGETGDDSNLAMVRARASYEPVSVQQFERLTFSDPVVLVRAPYRVSFAYAGPDRLWQDTWRQSAALPNVVRITLRDAATAQPLSISTAAIVHVNAPAECARAPNATGCAMPTATPAPAE
jgi:general secretion pathway protein J